MVAFNDLRSAKLEDLQVLKNVVRSFLRNSADWAASAAFKTDWNWWTTSPERVKCHPARTDACLETTGESVCNDRESYIYVYIYICVNIRYTYTIAERMYMGGRFFEWCEHDRAAVNWIRTGVVNKRSSSVRLLVVRWVSYPVAGTCYKDHLFLHTRRNYKICVLTLKCANHIYIYYSVNDFLNVNVHCIRICIYWLAGGQGALCKWIGLYLIRILL